MRRRINRISSLLVTTLILASCGPIQLPQTNSAQVSTPDRAGFQTQAQSPLPGVLPPQSHAFGKSYGEWASLWWKWAYTVPVSNHPLLDTTGANAAVGQSGNVWFLGGSFAANTVTRTISVPSGKALFFPILNSTYTEDHRVITGPNAPISGDIDTPEESLATVRANIGQAKDLTVTIDGVSAGDAQLRRYYTESPLTTFPILGGSLAEFYTGLGAWAGDTTAIDNIDAGYYLLLAPLSVGNHTIHFGGRLDNDPGADFVLDVTYHITVNPGAK